MTGAAERDGVGLCRECRHARRVQAAARLYWLCGLSRTDPRFEKYPRLPVRECPGFAPGTAAGDPPGGGGA